MHHRGAARVLEDVVEHLVERRLEQRGVTPDVGLRVELQSQRHSDAGHSCADTLRRRLGHRAERDADGEGKLERQAGEQQDLVGDAHQRLRLRSQAFRHHRHLIGGHLVITQHVGVAPQDGQRLLDLVRRQPHGGDRGAGLAVGWRRLGLEAGPQQPGDHQQQVLILRREDPGAFAEHGQGAADVSRVAVPRGAQVAHDAELLPHRQAFEWLAFAGVANVDDATVALLLDRGKRRLQRQSKSRLDGGPALDHGGHDFQRPVIDLARASSAWTRQSRARSITSGRGLSRLATTRWRTRLRGDWRSGLMTGRPRL